MRLRGECRLQIQTADFNNAAAIITGNCATEWAELDKVLQNMPLHLKPSGQAGRGGNPVFDPVGTNLTIQTDMLNLNTGWQAPIQISAQYSSLGTAVDLGKNGMLVEAQFAHYALLLNNTSRAEALRQCGRAVHRSADPGDRHYHQVPVAPIGEQLALLRAGRQPADAVDETQRLPNPDPPGRAADRCTGFLREATWTSTLGEHREPSPPKIHVASGSLEGGMLIPHVG